jgi:serine phosphatase RsbU (regulator of sigma subunit)
MSIFSSLAAKLFYYMTGLVVITVLGNSYQSYRSFSKYLSEQAATTLVARAESIGAGIETQINTWRSLVGIVVPTYAGDKKAYTNVLERFVDSNSDFLALGVYSAPSSTSQKLRLIAEAKTKNADDRRLGDVILNRAVVSAQKFALESVKNKLGTLAKTSKNTVTLSLAKQTKLPLMLLATRFETSNGKEVLWSILICWQTQLIKNLPTSEFVESAVVDSKGNIFSSNTLSLMTGAARHRSLPLVKEATLGKKMSDFVPEYLTGSNKRVIGGYYRLPEFDLATLVEENIEHAYEEMNKNLIVSMLWAMLFVLISMAFSLLGASGITKNIRKVVEATRNIASGNFAHKIEIKSKDEISTLAHSVNSMSEEIVKLIKDNMSKAEIERELATAKMVQSTFFPKKDVEAKNFMATGFYQPATQCGGDLWGHHEIADDLHLLYIADAMGHGAPAALVTAIAYSVSATVARLAKADRQFLTAPSVLLDHLNEVIFDAVGGTISMTFFCAFIDTKSGKMTYANAGHNFPFVIPNRISDPRQPKSQKSDLLMPISIKNMGNPLGMSLVTNYTDKEMDIYAGDKLFLFTDGLIECSDKHGHFWGRKTLLKQLANAANLPASELKDEILSRAFEMFAGNPLIDDVTVVVAEIPAAWQASTIYQEPSLVPELQLVQPIGDLVPEIIFQQVETLTKNATSSEAEPKKSYKIKL